MAITQRYSNSDHDSSDLHDPDVGFGRQRAKRRCHVRLVDREIKRIVKAPADGRHWRALLGIFQTFDQPVAALARYLTNSGRYPWQTTLRTPLGRARVVLIDRHDLLTINEVFCRFDYGSCGRRTVVDIGANAGFASLFFLTRHRDTRVWAFEPDAANLDRLRSNLAPFEGRYAVVEAAVTSNNVPSVRFVTAGRYGHIASASEAGVEVRAVSIACALRAIAREAGPIDLVKIDTEGTELDLVAAIPSDVVVREVRYEDNTGRVVAIHPPQIAVWPS
jgi:FkbM family methyltransferase